MYNEHTVELLTKWIALRVGTPQTTFNERKNRALRKNKRNFDTFVLP